jgi:hypothetical protein
MVNPLEVGKHYRLTMGGSSSIIEVREIEGEYVTVIVVIPPGTGPSKMALATLEEFLERDKHGEFAII